LEVLDFLAQLSPGQIGILFQSKGNWREVRCHQVREDSAVLYVQQNKGEGSIAYGKKVVFQTICDTGLLRAEGIANGSDNGRESFGIEFIPGDTIKVINRRQSYRVAASMSGKMAGTCAVINEEKYDSEWDCSLRDISVGGAKLVLAPPAPATRSRAMLTFQLPTENRPIVLPCVVVAAVEGGNPPPMSTVVRLSFLGLTSRMENQLSKFINWYQLEMRRKGIK
jgi:hypothetical protein